MQSSGQTTTYTSSVPYTKASSTPALMHAGALHYVINQGCTTFEGSALFAGTSYASVFPMNDLTHFPSSLMSSYYGSSFTKTLLEAGEDLPRFFLQDAACQKRCKAQQLTKEKGDKKADSKPRGL
jgi:hypothetical protein